MTRHRVSKRKRRPARRPTRRTKRNGGGWSDLVPGSFTSMAVSPGYPVHTPFSGVGKDCTGNFVRPGYIADYSAKGLPGLSGGRRRNRRSNKRRKSRGGMAMPSAATTYETSGGLVPNLRLDSITPKPGTFPDTTGVGGTVANPSVQKGGRYGMNPGAGPLNPLNGVGTSPAPFIHVPCEAARSNALNPTLITKGGGQNFPVVQVGAVDAMRYNAPTAGYRNDFTTFNAPSPVPGYLTQTPYDAKAFNPACMKTGGSRRKRRGGALPVAMNAAAVVPLKIGDIGTRGDFDGSSRGLPVKFGGRRRKSRK